MVYYVPVALTNTFHSCGFITNTELDMNNVVIFLWIIAVVSYIEIDFCL